MNAPESITWPRIVSAMLTLAAALFALQGRIDGWIERGIREDMNNTDMMTNKRIDSLEKRINSWRNTAEESE